MTKTKQGLAVVLCGLWILCKPAYALYPVFDFGEVIPVSSEVTTMAESLKNAKKQLMDIIDTKNAIGFGKRMAVFQKALAKIDTVTQSVKSATSVNKILDQQKSISSAIHNTVNSQVLKQAKVVTTAVDQVQTAINDGKIKPEIEEVSKDEAKEYVSNMFSDINDENKRIATEINDTLDSTLNTFNNNAEKNHQTLTELSEILEQDENIEPEKKKELQNKLDNIIQKERALTDKGASIVEAEKDKYEGEYKTKVVDGINNYQKTVNAYIEGVISKDGVVEEGAQLKQAMENFEIKPDQTVLDSYQQEATDLGNEIDALAEEIKQLSQNKDKSS